MTIQTKTPVSYTHLDVYKRQLHAVLDYLRNRAFPYPETVLSYSRMRLKENRLCHKLDHICLLYTSQGQVLRME